MGLNTEEITHIARLARLKLDPETQSEYGEKLASILEYVAKLQELDTTGVSELAHGAGLSNVFREDVPEVVDGDVRRRIIHAFVHRQGDLLEVPAVFERD